MSSTGAIGVWMLWRGTKSAAFGLWQDGSLRSRRALDRKLGPPASACSASPAMVVAASMATVIVPAAIAAIKHAASQQGGAQD